MCLSFCFSMTYPKKKSKPDSCPLIDDGVCKHRRGGKEVMHTGGGKKGHNQLQPNTSAHNASFGPIKSLKKEQSSAFFPPVSPPSLNSPSFGHSCARQNQSGGRHGSAKRDGLVLDTALRSRPPTTRRLRFEQ